MGKRILPPTFFTTLLILTVGFHLIFPLFVFIFSPYNYLGIILIIFGGIINLWTDSFFKKKKTTVKPQEMPSCLIESGPFKISRHPMYFGMVSILFGMAIFLGSMITFVFPIIFIIIIEKLFIPVEEKNLEKKFGNKYINYKKSVRRWI